MGLNAYIETVESLCQDMSDGITQDSMAAKFLFSGRTCSQLISQAKKKKKKCSSNEGVSEIGNFPKAKQTLNKTFKCFRFK